MPGTKTAAGGIARQPPFHPQCDQRRAATTWCLPLPPQSGPESQPDPASEGDEHFGCFAEAEIADPAPHIRGCDGQSRNITAKAKCLSERPNGGKIPQWAYTHRSTPVPALLEPRQLSEVD